MNAEPFPVVNGCYLDYRNNMIKVRMLSYFGNEIMSVLFEDVYGNLSIINAKKWQNMKLIPCCLASNRIHQSRQPIFPG